MPSPVNATPLPTLDSAESLLDQLPLALILADENGAVLSVNMEAQIALGISEAKLVGQPIAPYIHIDVMADADWHTLFAASARLPQTTATLRSRTGTSTPILLEAAPVVHEGAPALALYFSTQTSHANAEDSSLRNASMANILAHEIKNPLTGIRGAAQLLKKHVPDAAQKFTAVIIQEVDRIRALIDEMVDFSEETKEEFQPINIHEILRHCVTLIANNGQTALTIKESFDPSLPEVRGQRDKLIQLFLNLMLNAQEALADTAEPTLNLRSFYRHGLPASIVIQVEDNGPGIPPEVANQMLEPFVSTKPGSRGLGLAVAAKVASAHKGSLQLVESKAGSTLFEICLPRWK